MCDDILISIHALAKRATLFVITYSGEKSIFQSTPSQRGRLFMRTDNDIVVVISIHALAKRATKVNIDVSFKTSISIHALAKRATQQKLYNKNMKVFQSTPSQRGRQWRKRTAPRADVNFNPRPRKEGDLKTDKYKDSVSISIHALAKRATRTWWC